MPVCTAVLPAHWGRAASQPTQPRLPDLRSPNSPAAQVTDALSFATAKPPSYTRASWSAPLLPAAASRSHCVDAGARAWLAVTLNVARTYKLGAMQATTSHIERPRIVRGYARSKCCVAHRLPYRTGYSGSVDILRHVRPRTESVGAWTTAERRLSDDAGFRASESFFPKPCMCQACEDGQGRREVEMTCAGHANFNNWQMRLGFWPTQCRLTTGALESPCRVSSLAKGNTNPTPLS
jgi:hypothetical protein